MSGGQRPIVLDASAILAFVNDEPGGAEVALAFSRGVASSVNWCEVLTKAEDTGTDTAGLREDLEALGLRILAFSAEDAEGAAGLRAATRSAGLSLGDRACIGLAQRLGAKVLTTERAWGRLPLGLDIRVLTR